MSALAPVGAPVVLDVPLTGLANAAIDRVA